MTVFEKTAFYVGILLTLVLLYMIFFSKNGVMEYGRLKQQESEIAAQTSQVAKENRKIEREIKSLKHDINYLKHLAKHEHEMAEPGELIFKDAADKKGKNAMSQEFNTLELARIYERQGYIQDAFDMYQALSSESLQVDDPARKQKINAGLARMASALENPASQLLAHTPPGKGIDLLLEQWLVLLMLQKRVDLMKPLNAYRQQRGPGES